jgi:aminoglycoside 2'-N-acetyltransferase I
MKTYANELKIEVVSGLYLSNSDYEAIVGLCSQAYEEDYRPFLQSFINPVHIMGKLNGRLVCHALWITRWLQVGEQRPMRTAYVEAVATDENFRGHGYATTVMQRLAEKIQDYEIGGLSPAETTLYAQLGWEFWQGSLFTRTKDGGVPNPEEKVMILRLPNTPEIDLCAPLSIEWREEEVW